MPATPILFCSHVVELGGAEMVLLDLLAALDREQFTPHLAVPASPAPGGGPLPQRAAELGVEVHEVPLGGSKRWQKALAVLRGARALRKLAKRLQCRLLVANSMIAGYAAVRAQHESLACIWHLHIVTDSDIARSALRRASAVITPSRAGFESAGIMHAGVHNDHICPNGVPDRFFDAADANHHGALRMQLSIPPQAPLLGMVGRLDPRKGHQVLLRALADWPDSSSAPHLAIAGAELFSDVQPRLAGFADQLRHATKQPSLAGRVHWLGDVADTAPLLAQLDALVVPSTDLESAPRTIAEAQAAGCPVVASELGGIPEMLEHGAAGLLTVPNDAQALRQALQALLGSSSKRDEWVRASRERAQAYRMEVFVHSCERLFAGVAPARKGGTH